MRAALAPLKVNIAVNKTNEAVIGSIQTHIILSTPNEEGIGIDRREYKSEYSQ